MNKLKYLFILLALLPATLRAQKVKEQNTSVSIHDPTGYSLYRSNGEAYEDTYEYIGLFTASDGTYYLRPVEAYYSVLYNDCLQDSIVVLAPAQSGCLVMISGLAKYNNQPMKSLVDTPFELWPRDTLPFTVGKKNYTLQASCRNSDFRESSMIYDYHLYIAQKGKREKQMLLTIPEIQSTVLEILFIGDIDGDGLPDLLVNAPSNYENRRLVLFLSSFAKRKELLHFVSEDFNWFDC